MTAAAFSPLVAAGMAGGAGAGQPVTGASRRRMSVLAAPQLQQSGAMGAMASPTGGLSSMAARRFSARTGPDARSSAVGPNGLPPAPPPSALVTAGPTGPLNARVSVTSAVAAKHGQLMQARGRGRRGRGLPGAPWRFRVQEGTDWGASWGQDEQGVREGAVWCGVVAQVQAQIESETAALRKCGQMLSMYVNRANAAWGEAQAWAAAELPGASELEAFLYSEQNRIYMAGARGGLLLGLGRAGAAGRLQRHGLSRWLPVKDLQQPGGPCPADLVRRLRHGSLAVQILAADDWLSGSERRPDSGRQSGTGGPQTASGGAPPPPPAGPAPHPPAEAAGPASPGPHAKAAGRGAPPRVPGTLPPGVAPGARRLSRLDSGGSVLGERVGSVSGGAPGGALLQAPRRRQQDIWTGVGHRLGWCQGGREGSASCCASGSRCAARQAGGQLGKDQSLSPTSC
jgi:hypothetical protein